MATRRSTHRSKVSETRSLTKKRPPNLSDQIFQTLVTSEFHEKDCSFSPEGSLDKLITKNSVVWAFYKKGVKPPEEIPESLETTVKFILERARKLFAISIRTRFKDDELRQVMELFMVKEISDSDLPFDEQTLTSLFLQPLAAGHPIESILENSDRDSLPDGDDSGISFDQDNNGTEDGYNDANYDGSDGNEGDDDESGDEDDDDDEESDEEYHESPWDFDAIRDFCNHQWGFCAPVLSAGKVNHDLHQNAILPFIKKYADSADKGAFGRVTKYEIHESHLDAQELIPGAKYVAVKEIELEKDQDQAAKFSGWEKEVEALWRMKELDQKHIVKFITAFCRGEQDHYLMLEWADGGNLRNLWKNFPRDVLTGELVKATFGQLLGLAQALYKAHAGNHTGGFYRHGDLKPENILWFKDQNRPRNKLGTLKIGDWGLAKQHQIVTELRTKETTTRYGTQRYEAPEEATADNASLHVPDSSGKQAKKRSRLYDVWAMGCISLEFLVWLMYGRDGLSSFNRSVREGRSDNVPFYEVVQGKGGKREAQVHHMVTKWMNHMAQDPICSVGETALGNLLELIRDRLLVVKLPDGLGSAVDMSTMERATSINSPDDANTSSSVVISPPESTPITVNVPEITFLEAESLAAPGGVQPELPPRPLKATRGRRARAKDFFDHMEIISGKDKPESYWFTDPPQPPPHLDVDEGLIPPSDDVGYQTEDTTGVASRDPPEEAPVGQWLAIQASNMAPTERRLNNDWNYVIDNKGARRILSSMTKHLSAPQAPQPSNLCGACETFCENLWTPASSASYDLATLERNSIDNVCDLCRLFWSVCKQGDTVGAARVSFNRVGSTLTMNGYGPAIASIFRSPDLDLRTHLNENIQVGLPGLPAAGSEAYLEIIRQWLTICDYEHPNCFRDSSGNSSGSLGPTKKLPTRVIAVGGREDDKVQLLETSSSHKGEWIALSHQWGTGPQFCTTRENLHDHLDGINVDRLPASFRDAVEVTRALGCAYLWIDSLCIIQGPGGDFSQEAKRMEQVYSGAYCVLAASRSPGHYAGFLGPRQEKHRVCLQRSRDSAPFFISETIDDFSVHVLDGPLSKRGWVLQEHALARRTVYFTDYQTYFECGDGVRCETMSKMKNQVAAFLGDPNFPQLIMKADKAKKILGYQDLYKRYCRLALSHAADRPWAINGLQERILKTLGIKGGFGVFFENEENGRRRGMLRRSLLWCRAEDNDTLSRIDFSAGRVVNTVPSWSWMAYTGGIDYIPADFGGMDWSPIQTQWDSGPNRADEGVLIAEARGYKVDYGRAKIVFDCCPVPEQPASKCVVLGKEKRTMPDKDKVHYVLLVQARLSSGHDRPHVYERIGVGILPGKCIEPNGVRISIH